MAQQTQAPRVAAAYGPFLERFPSVESLALASRADVVRSWAGLGYNRRAVALRDAARTIVEEYGGCVPYDTGALLRLPGVGPYTAAAVASIAYGRPVAAVDANVRRVVARVFRGAEPDELAPGAIRADADRWLDAVDPGAWNQALMDLGREVCRIAPRCDVCPLSAACSFRRSGRRGRPSVRPRSPFEGSLRQLRGAVVDALRDRRSLDDASLALRLGAQPARLARAVEALADDGLVERTPTGRVRLAR